MSVTNINDQMLQYGQATEYACKKPKHQKEYGIKRPDSKDIVAVLAGLFVIVVAISVM